MKRLVFIPLLFLTIHFAQAQESNLIGVWGIENAPEPISIIEFNTDNTGVLNIEGQSFEINNYLVTTDSDPVVVELSTEFNNQPATLYAVIDFTGANTMLIELFSPGNEKPVAFSESDENKFTLSRL